MRVFYKARSGERAFSYTQVKIEFTIASAWMILVIDFYCGAQRFEPQDIPFLPFRLAASTSGCPIQDLPLKRAGRRGPVMDSVSWTLMIRDQNPDILLLKPSHQ